MDILKNFKVAQRTKKTTFYDTGGYSGSFYFGSRNNWDEAISLPTVYRCVDFLSNAVANLPLKPYKENGEVDENSELYNLLRRAPNKFMSAYTFKKMIVQSLLLKGNAFVKIKRKGNKVEELEYVDPGRVQCSCFASGGINIGVAQYTVDGVATESEDLLHFINYSTDGIWGKSTLEIIKDTLKISGGQLDCQEEIFSNRLYTRGILSTDGNLCKEQKEQIRDNWNGRSGIPVLSNGIKFQSVAISPVDAQLIDGQKYTDELILAAFGLKLSNLFNISGPYGSIEQNQIDFLTNTLSPLLQKIENEFERKLGVEVNFDVTQILRSDRSSLVNQGAILLQNGIATPAEIRETLGMDTNPEVLDSLKSVNNSEDGTEDVQNTTDQ